MPDFPWFKFYSSKYLSSQGAHGLNPIQEYMFLRLIVFSSLSHPRGTFTDDLYVIREFVRWDSMANAIAGLIAGLNGKNGQLYGKPHSYLDDEAFYAVVKPVLAKFRHDTENHFYWNDVVAAQVDTPKSGHSEAGKKGAQKRWAGHIKPDSKANGPATVEVRSKNVLERDREIPDNLDELTEEIGHLHPAAAHLKGKFLPENWKFAIGEAIVRDGEDAVRVGTLNYRDAVAKWPKSEMQFITNPVKFYGPEAHYGKDPQLWEKGGNEQRQVGSKGQARQQRNQANIITGILGDDCEVSGFDGISPRQRPHSGRGEVLEGVARTVPSGSD